MEMKSSAHSSPDVDSPWPDPPKKQPTARATYLQFKQFIPP